MATSEANLTEATPLLEDAIERENGGLFQENNKNASAMFWDEFYTVSRYTIPVIGFNLLEFSLVFVPTISIGHLSTKALAGITLGSMTASVTGLSILQGFASALDTLLPSAWTSSEPHVMGLWAQRMSVVMIVAMIPILTLWFNAERVLLFLKQDPDVAHMAARYLRWISLGLPAYAFNAISRRYFLAQGLFSVPTHIIMAVAPINALINYILVWGPEPVRLGYIGAPIASAISLILVSLFSLFYGVYFMSRKAWHPISMHMFSRLGLVAGLGLAGVGQTASKWWSWELVSVAASLLGPTVLAGQAILLTSAGFAFQLPFSLGVTTAVRIGNLLGEKKAKRAKAASYASMGIALCLSASTSIPYFALRKKWGYLFNDDPDVVKLVASIMPIVALFQVVDGNAAVTAAILRARGKQFIGAMLNLSAYYIIGFPIGIWLAFRLHLGLYGLWLGFTVSLIYCAIVGIALCINTDWEHEVTKALKRVEEDKVKRSQDTEQEAST